MASGIYNQFKADLMNKIVDLEADTIKIALLDDSHSFSATDTTWADVSANEVSGTGYTAGGATLANKAVTEAATTKWDADDATWTITGSLTAYHAVIYDDTASDNLIASIDFGGAKTATDGDFTVSFHADGIITLAE